MDVTKLSGASVLVTGGAGFIGSHLVDGLLEAGARVRVLDNLCSGRRENLPVHERLEFLERDIRDLEACRAGCEGAKFVFHQAALGSVPRSLEDPATTIAVNVGGTSNVFAAARDAGVSRVVYASSSSVYGDSQALPKKEGEEGQPLSPYATSKAMNEQLADLFGRCFGMQFIGLRYFNVYGPRQDPNGPYAAVVPRFFDALLHDREPTVYGDGEQSRDFTFVKDAVQANLRAACAVDSSCGRAYNVGAMSATTINELVNQVAGVVGRPCAPIYEPARKGDVEHSLASCAAAERSFGYRARFALAHGLKEAFVGYSKR